MNPETNPALRYSATGPGRDLFFRILDILSDRIARKGRIQASDAIKLTRRDIGQAIARAVFNNIMAEMIDRGLAKKVGRGRYEILEDGAVLYAEPPPPRRKPKEEADYYQRLRAAVPAKKKLEPFFSKVYGKMIQP